MKILLLTFLYSFKCFHLKKIKSQYELNNTDLLDALTDYECRECGYNFNDGQVVDGRILSVVPIIHPVYKLTLEFYVLTYGGTDSWNNFFHFTRKSDKSSQSCIENHFGLWVRFNDITTRYSTILVSACVNGKERELWPVVSKGAWHSLEYGQYASRNPKNDTTYHYYVKVDDEIFHEEQNFDPLTFQDMKVYASDPLYKEAYGLIRNFKYRKYDDFCLNYCP